MKILPYQIDRIMSLVAQHTVKAPQFLDLLSAIVKVEEINLPLKRNQGYVMKSFMEYRTAVAFVLDQPAADRSVLDQPAADRSVPDQSAADRSVPDQSAADRSVLDQSAAERSVLDQSAADRSEEISV